MEMTLGEAFARSARKFPEKVACMDDEASLTYDQLNRRGSIDGRTPLGGWM